MWKSGSRYQGRKPRTNRNPPTQDRRIRPRQPRHRNPRMRAANSANATTSQAELTPSLPAMRQSHAKSLSGENSSGGT
jgi:hypothetical protein